MTTASKLTLIPSGSIWSGARLQFRLNIVFVALILSACGGGSTSAPPAAQFFPIHALAGKMTEAAASSSAVVSGNRGDYILSKTSTGYTVSNGSNTQTFPSDVQTIVFNDVSVNLGVGAKSQAISADDLQSIEELYIAFFNRVPDADGLTYWIDQFKAGQSINTIADNFYYAAQQYSALTGYSSSMTLDQFVTKIYANVLGRTGTTAPNADELAYWRNDILSGRQTRGTVVRAMLTSAHLLTGDNTWGWVAKLLDNKVKLANLFSVQQGLNYNTAQDSITKTMALVAAITPISTSAAVGLMGRIDWGYRQVASPAFKSAPIPTLKSSYENKTAAAAAIGPQTILSGDAVAFADFFQDGTYSMVTHTLIYNNQDLSTANKFGSIHFWKKVNGSWIDNTSTLLADATGCLHPRKAIVADFNGDGIPDVFFACHGFDAPPFPSEHPHVLLSQTDGTYKNVTLSITCFCHGASAADVNGDGYPDIAIVDQFIARTPNFLINNKDGTFTQDLTRLPVSLMDRQIYSAELIDFDKSGKYDLWLAGNEPNSTKTPIDPRYTQAPTIYKNDGAGNYKTITPIVLPGDTTNGAALDINFTNDSIYLLRTSIYDVNTTYNTAALQKIAYPSLTSRTIYTGLNGWVNWIIPYQGNIVSLNAAYGVSVPQ